MGYIIFLLLVILAIAVFSYNGLQKRAQLVREKSSNIQVTVSKKLNLVNQLIDVVKSFQEGEQLVQLKVSADNTTSAIAGAYQQSNSVLSTVQGMAERFPNLKSNEQYHRLIDSIQNCENEIQSKGQIYNECVRAYNTKRAEIPTVFVARYMGFSEAPYLEFDHSGVQDVTTLNAFRTDDGERLEQVLAGAGNKMKGLAENVGKAGVGLVERIKEETKK